MSKTGTVEVLRLRAIYPLLGHRYARRFAQDDGLVGGVKKNISNSLAVMGRNVWVRVRPFKVPPGTTERVNRNMVVN
jgi:hypothetical protein